MVGEFSSLANRCHHGVRSVSLSEFKKNGSRIQRWQAVMSTPTCTKRTGKKEDWTQKDADLVQLLESHSRYADHKSSYNQKYLVYRGPHYWASESLNRYLLLPTISEFTFKFTVTLSFTSAHIGGFGGDI